MLSTRSLVAPRNQASGCREVHQGTNGVQFSLPAQGWKRLCVRILVPQPLGTSMASVAMPRFGQLKACTRDCVPSAHVSTGQSMATRYPMRLGDTLGRTAREHWRKKTRIRRTRPNERLAS